MELKGVPGLQAQPEPRLVLCFLLILVLPDEHPPVGCIALVTSPPALGIPAGKREQHLHEI